MKRWIMLIILAVVSLLLFLLFYNTNAQLHTVEAEFSATQTQLESTRTELNTTKVELGSTKTKLEATSVKLVTTETELQSTKDQLQSTETKLASTETELRSAETELASALTDLSTVQAELDEKEIELIELQVNYEGLMAGHGYTIKDPTYSELMRFLADDDTDKAEYIKGEYECTEFSTDLCNRAEERGIRCAYVTIQFPDGMGHAIVAFNTIDKGLTYIEPQHDDLVKIVIGKPFYQCIMPKPDYYYTKPPYDDTIEEVLVAW